MDSEPPIAKGPLPERSDHESRYSLYPSYIRAVIAVGAVAIVLAPFRDIANSTTVALAFLLSILFIATLLGSRPALLASVVAMLAFNFFSLPPYHTLTIADPQNWVALAAFFVTAITVGQLSARDRERAAQAVRARHEIEGLYEQLREAFEQASHAEALRQSEALKSALLDAVTHDIRTPLTSIKASVTTLLDDGTDGSDDQLPGLGPEGRQELLEVINEEADRLNDFVEGLIELARIEAGEIRLRRRWGVIDEIIAAALKRAEPLTRSHQVEVEIEKDLPAARVDSSAVAEVVYTLIDNATKYAPVNTRIRIEAGLVANDMIELAVEDEGPGIPVSLRENVFDKFFSVTRTADQQPARPVGIGMGLSIARGIVSAHGGEIRVVNARHGNGTRVVFTVPVGDEEGTFAFRSGATEDMAYAVTGNDE